jgi:DNA-binding NarL/FixJ family response regulator
MQGKIIIADDHPLFRAALQQALRQALGELQLIEADSFMAVQAAAEAHPDADLVLLDLQMPGANGFSGLVYLRGQYPALPVVVVSAHEEAKVVYRAVEHGASGFIPKSAPLPRLVEALQAVLAGDVWLPPDLPPRQQPAAEAERDYAQRLTELTPQQFRVLTLMAEGLLNKQIADRLDISEATIKAHVTAILRKLGAQSRTQAAVAFQSLAVEPNELGG